MVSLSPVVRRTPQVAALCGAILRLLLVVHGHRLVTMLSRHVRAALRVRGAAVGPAKLAPTRVAGGAAVRTQHMLAATHEVLNQADPLGDYNAFTEDTVRVSVCGCDGVAWASTQCPDTTDLSVDTMRCRPCCLRPSPERRHSSMLFPSGEASGVSST